MIRFLSLPLYIITICKLIILGYEYGDNCKMGEVVFDHLERNQFETEASIFAIIRCIEQLERAWINDKIDSDDEYNMHCKKLIS